MLIEKNSKIVQMYNSELMNEYPTFAEYLDLQTKFDEIAGIVSNNPTTNDIESRMIATLQFKGEPHCSELVDSNQTDFNGYVLPEFPAGWEEILTPLIPEMQNSLQFVNNEIRRGKTIFPFPEHFFSFIDGLDINNIKVIIIGQDPYPNRDKNSKLPMAHGMAFSSTGTEIPNSLRNVFKEIETTMGVAPQSPNLTFLKNQGVMLINTCLTVNEGDADSHCKNKVWFEFVRKLINIILAKIPFCFVCTWGEKAKRFIKNGITYGNNVKILEAGHPSGINTSKTSKFLGCRNFIDINNLLLYNGFRPIDWSGCGVEYTTK